MLSKLPSKIVFGRKFQDNGCCKREEICKNMRYFTELIRDSGFSFHKFEAFAIFLNYVYRKLLINSKN